MTMIIHDLKNPILSVKHGLELAMSKFQNIEMLN